MTDNTAEQQNELSIDLFNVSGEFEDIEFTINEEGHPEMNVIARRC